LAGGGAGTWFELARVTPRCRLFTRLFYRSGPMRENTGYPDISIGLKQARPYA
jgi:hypothetical protein